MIWSKPPDDSWVDEDERRLCSNLEFLWACLLILHGLWESKIDFDKVKKVKLEDLVQT